MWLDSFVADGVESLVRLTKYRPDFPVSSDYRLGVSGAPQYTATSSVIREIGILGKRKAPAGDRNLKVISWNLLRLTGAGVEDVAALVERHHPDLLFLQEAIEELANLPVLVGGYFFREPLEGRVYGLAVWSPHPLLRPYALRLPVSQVPGRVPPRVAQIVQLGDVTFANVHLSHGQFLNRWQLMHIANALDGPAAIVGDYNAVGPIKLAGFKDVGPRQPTHSPNDIISFRLDRCMARSLRCSYARVLTRGSSDHHPILLKLHILPVVQVSDEPVTARVWRPMLRVSVESWLRVIREAPARIRVRQIFLEALDLKLRRAKRGKAKRQRPSPASNDITARQRIKDRSRSEIR